MVPQRYNIERNYVYTLYNRTRILVHWRKYPEWIWLGHALTLRMSTFWRDINVILDSLIALPVKLKTVVPFWQFTRPRSCGPVRSKKSFYSLGPRLWRPGPIYGAQWWHVCGGVICRIDWLCSVFLIPNKTTMEGEKFK